MSIAIETPDSVQRKIDFLRESFSQLVASFPDDKTLLEISRQYDTWHYNASNSLLSKLFVSSLASEYEQWQKRYSAEYLRLTGKNPEVDTAAPKPEIVMNEEKQKSSPWIWAIVAGSIGIVTATYLYVKAKK